MKVAKSVADVLRNHVVLEVEGIDRMYLNAYVPMLQTPEGVAHFLRFYRKQRFASTVALEPMTRAFVEAIERFVKSEGIPLMTFEKGQRKDDVAAEYRRAYGDAEGVVFVGKAQDSHLAVGDTFLVKRMEDYTDKKYGRECQAFALNITARATKK